MSYNTPGRRWLISFMADHAERPLTVDQIYQNMPAGLAGKSSLYRLTEALCREGVLRRFRDQGMDAAAFQYVGDDSHCHTHLHLKCAACERLIHLECALGNQLLDHIEEHHGFAVDSRESVLLGLCADCRKTEK